MIPSQIKALSFDAVGTLIAPHPSVGAVYAQAMAKYGIVLEPTVLEDRFGSAFRSAKKDLRFEDAEEREYEFWKSIVRQMIELGEEPTHFDFDKLFDALWRLFATGKPWKPIDGARETLETLSRSYPLALLTNWDSRARSAFNDLGLLGLFKCVIISSEVGFDKPDRRIFAAAADKLGVSTSEILHVGDSFGDDIEGAINASCSAAWLSKNNDRNLPDRASRISELSALIGSKPPASEGRT